MMMMTTKKLVPIRNSEEPDDVLHHWDASYRDLGDDLTGSIAEAYDRPRWQATEALSLTDCDDY